MITTSQSPVQSAVQSTIFDLDELNHRYNAAHPREILAWCLENIPTGLVQTTALSISGLTITDILYRDLKPNPPVPIIFTDTLHHFPETLELLARVQEFYNPDLRIYKTQSADSRKDFALKHGVALWHSDVNKFHYLTKVEPLQRALAELETVAWITGRRRDQAVTRSQMQVFEVDHNGRIKVNPMAKWTYKQTWAYIHKHGVIYNPLYDQGYTSIGDQPLTTRVALGEDERAGRWRGSNKTECGLHI
ncbi:MAG: phosphoadenosine phosphosulfate reductase [Symploca sp. SIO3C6]|uniref:Phosphoadenosine 5'-phosphosulfate reductase n=1 Tax=Symploca sp. SIO1C4 TaxID=2607765 RepID=A0A6B3N4V9_9CYAN|nr:phosphoadenosine phosphosulfate reductase [Symploca sp. SIO3C6]NER28119.1 phosphoadenosine phosphosulfate reductase [Symploca sp. SIO1C4]NET08423.1 phosphoadenosine phosphosulfate reductase [Symploca sp. SIO2B6]